MKSWAKTLTYAVGILLYASTIEAAPLHGDYRPEASKIRADWFAELQQIQDAEYPSAFANEKFRNIPQGKTTLLTFEEENGDPLGLFSASPVGASDRFQKKWIELLFGVRSWDLEENNSYVPISAQSTSAIPLPTGFFLFIGGLGGILLLGRLKKQTKGPVKNSITS